MFKEQYHRDNEKLHAKETLLMEIKNQYQQESQQDPQDQRPSGDALQQDKTRRRNTLLRYGAIAAAVVLVVTATLGIVLTAPAKGTGDQMVQNAEAATAEAPETNQASVAQAAVAEGTTAAGQARRTLFADTQEARALESYDELYELMQQIWGTNDDEPATTEAAAEDGAGEMAEMDMGMSTSSSNAMAGGAESARAAAEDMAGYPAGDYSQTNTQVIGVDEADIVKTDGECIYYIANNQLNILSAAGVDAKLLSSTLFTGDDKWWGYASEMYLQGDRLMIITQGYATVWTGAGDRGFGANQERTQVQLYDVSNPEKPRLLNTLGQSGSYISSRMIGEYVYIVTSHYVWNARRSAVDSYVPQLISDGVDRAIPAGDILVYGTPVTSAFTVIGAVNIESGTDYATAKAVFGGASDVYCNMEHLLLSSSQYDQEVGDIAPDENGKNVQVTKSTSNTKLMLFALDEETITFKASATIPGTLINQFAMDEYQEVFRLVTTCNNWEERIYTDGVDTYEYDNETYNCLYTLDSELKPLGQLENLAKDEMIESVRFDGQIVYFVTFRQVDPLFAVDLSNPKAPKVLSELKIPGFSEYLHRYGDGLLMGLGYEADEKTGQTKGVKLSMFDIKNPRAVTEITTSRIDADWTAVGSNHKAILVSVEKNIIAFPADNAYYIFRYTDGKGFEQLAKTAMQEDLNNWNLRGVFVDEYFYVLGDSGMTVISMKDWTKVAHLTISYG